jgi:hypothetical protein
MSLTNLAACAAAACALTATANARAEGGATEPEPAWGSRGQIVLPKLLGYSFFSGGVNVAPTAGVASGPCA